MQRRIKQRIVKRAIKHLKNPAVCQQHVCLEINDVYIYVMEHLCLTCWVTVCHPPDPLSGNQKWSSRFEASKHNTVYYLTVKSFTPRDQGKYFCVMNLNQMLYFSPATTVVAPTTPEPTPKHGITEDPNLNTLDPGNLNAGREGEGKGWTLIQEDLNFFCHIFIWVPLAGACLLLFIALVITIVLCQRRCSGCFGMQPIIRTQSMQGPLLKSVSVF
uniref:T-cell surface glycoprotein CD8 alpha chain-like n=1 Tax=Cyanistes caeruleus TaxID=156563 RepID=A0A8C0U7Q8_CYACU